MKVAVISFVYQEPRFLPVWCAYYAAQVGKENLFIINDGDSELTVCPGVNVINLPRQATFSEKRKCHTLSHMQQLLLHTYDYVIYSDVDELVVVDPVQFQSLKHFLSETNQPTYTTCGLEIVHVINQEVSLDWHNPIMPQRGWCRFSTAYCKTAITRGPLDWFSGLHYTELSAPPSTDLFTLHLKCVDLAYACEKHTQNQMCVFDPEEVQLNLGWHWRMDLSQFVKRNFMGDVSHGPIKLHECINALIQLKGINSTFDQAQLLHEIPVNLRNMPL